MKKKVLAILLASTMTLAFTACGSSDDGASTSGDSGETASAIPRHRMKADRLKALPSKSISKIPSREIRKHWISF